MPDGLTVVSLITSPTPDLDATAHTRAWVIPCASTEAFAQAMTERYGQPIESVATNGQLRAEYEHAATNGTVFVDPEEK